MGAAKDISDNDMIMNNRQPWIIGPVSRNELLPILSVILTLVF